MNFDYKILSDTGEVEKGSLEASSRADALTKLKDKGTLLDLVELDSESSSSQSRFPTLEFRGIRPAQICFTFRQLGELMDAGLPLATALSSLQKFCGNAKMKTILQDVGNKIRAGNSLSEALKAQGKAFDHIHIAMVKVGERSGNLPEMLKKIAELIEEQLELRGKVRSALSYPFFVLAFSSILCWGLVTFLLPNFEPIWTGAKLDLSAYPVTVFLLDLSKLSRNPLDEFLLVLFLSLLSAIFWQLTRTDQGRSALGTFVLKVPVFGHYLRLSSTTGASSTLAMLLNSGLPLLEAMDLTAETSGNPVIANGIREAAKRVRAGNNLSTSLDEVDVFPELFIQMVSVGEATGDMPSLLDRVSNYYKRQLDDSLRSLTSLIEPVTMVIIGGVVFVFVLGVFLPIMGIVSALSTG